MFEFLLPPLAAVAPGGDGVRAVSRCDEDAADRVERIVHRYGADAAFK
jgi:hypothetical protein